VSFADQRINADGHPSPLFKGDRVQRYRLRVFHIRQLFQVSHRGTDPLLRL
jgi:hypothetical protein